jgi:hypothetical protein
MSHVLRRQNPRRRDQVALPERAQWSDRGRELEHVRDALIEIVRERGLTKLTKADYVALVREHEVLPDRKTLLKLLKADAEARMTGQRWYFPAFSDEVLAAAGTIAWPRC